MRDLGKNAAKRDKKNNKPFKNANKIEGRKVKEPKLKCSNAEMASSTAVTSPFDSLPDELALKIVTMAAWSTDTCTYEVEVENAEGERYIDERQVTYIVPSPYTLQ